MVDWPKGCGAALKDNTWLEIISETREIYSEHNWNPEVECTDFNPGPVCGSQRGNSYWRYYCKRCARRTGLIW